MIMGPHQVELYRLTDSRNDTDPWGTWEVMVPGGGTLDISESTSQGLQEAIDFAAEHGYDLHVYGGGIAHGSGQDVAILMVTERLRIPCLQGCDWNIHATINICGPDPDPVAAVEFDSMMNTTIRWTGQIVCAPGWGPVLFKPDAELPQDPNGPIITASRIWLPSVIKCDNARTCIELDARGGGITGNFFEFLEPNGGSTGIKVLAGATNLFDHNHVTAREIHGQATSVQAGDLTNGAQVLGNVWDVSCQPTSIGAEIFGHNERWAISVDNREGSPSCVLTLNPGAAGNLIDVLRHDVTGAPINNASGNSTNTIRGV